MKKQIGNALALYPTPLVVVGTMVDGKPNWCGTIAPPLASWLHKNDLSGKILLPFYSHCYVPKRMSGKS